MTSKQRQNKGLYSSQPRQNMESPEARHRNMTPTTPREFKAAIEVKTNL
ncbi:hypothetical protein FOXB_07368 [Fusarium oxysporum f. sp. conglutinans Fo5176]|uniref:Uncharacterized protein n=1 Tax=Fusarium oxysporum (strain Fo5176) TaxID=660025 RepID=F9FLT8_FUSOF|nr:hypothetical protein FOXB_07368 [Fusarium oxysporum f. sp. conglutinans Fo5176]